MEPKTNTILEITHESNTATASKIRKADPLDDKNAYSNYDDHCTVVVAIEYAFFKGGSRRGSHEFLASWGGVTCPQRASLSENYLFWALLKLLNITST